MYIFRIILIYELNIWIHYRKVVDGALSKRHTGFIEEQKEKMGSTDINDAIKPTGKLKARFFQLDRDTGQDMDNRRRGDRDYSSFPEKKGLQRERERGGGGRKNYSHEHNDTTFTFININISFFRIQSRC